MAKHTGMTIRIGAAYDQVEVRTPNLNNGRPTVYDRSQMRKDGKPELQGALRRQVVDTWAQINDQRKGKKLSRADRIAGQHRDKARRERA